MSLPAHETNLADRRYITLILRLTLEQAGRLIQGELVDTMDTLRERFIDVAGLNRAVRDWLARHEHAEDET